MSGGYYFLVASLPTLNLGAPLRFTPRQFLDRCAGQVSAAHYRMLAELELFQAQPAKTGLTLLDHWHERERALRTTLAVARAKRLGVTGTADPRQLQQDRVLAELAERLLTLDSPLAADEALDRFRWRLLEELAFGHYFEVETLVIYGLKLKILERRACFDTTTGVALLDRMLAHGAERGREALSLSGN